MSGYALHPEAYDDLDEIRAYIAEDNPDAADRVVNEIFGRIRQLIPFPDQGFRRPNLTQLPLRFAHVREYVVAYAPENKPLWVLAVFMLAVARALSPPFCTVESRIRPHFFFSIASPAQLISAESDPQASQTNLLRAHHSHRPVPSASGRAEVKSYLSPGS